MWVIALKDRGRVSYYDLEDSCWWDIVYSDSSVSSYLEATSKCEELRRVCCDPMVSLEVIHIDDIPEPDLDLTSSPPY